MKTKISKIQALLNMLKDIKEGEFKSFVTITNKSSEKDIEIFRRYVTNSKAVKKIFSSRSVFERLFNILLNKLRTGKVTKIQADTHGYIMWYMGKGVYDMEDMRIVLDPKTFKE